MFYRVARRDLRQGTGKCPANYRRDRGGGNCSREGGRDYSDIVPSMILLTSLLILDIMDMDRDILAFAAYTCNRYFSQIMQQETYRIT